jgi:hypothetical protein
MEIRFPWRRSVPGVSTQGRADGIDIRRHCAVEIGNRSQVTHCHGAAGVDRSHDIAELFIAGPGPVRCIERHDLRPRFQQLDRAFHRRRNHHLAVRVLHLVDCHHRDRGGCKNRLHVGLAVHAQSTRATQLGGLGHHRHCRWSMQWVPGPCLARNHKPPAELGEYPFNLRSVFLGHVFPL